MEKGQLPASDRLGFEFSSASDQLILNPSSPCASVVPFAKRGPRRKGKTETSPADALTELRAPPAPTAPGALPQPRSRASPPSPSTAGSSPPLTSEPQAGGRAEAEPRPSPSERAGWRAKAQQRRTAAGARPQPSPGLPASPAAGQPRVPPGAAAHDPGRQGAAGTPIRWVPSPKDGRVPGRAALYLGRVGPFFPSSAPGPAGARWPVGN